MNHEREIKNNAKTTIKKRNNCNSKRNKMDDDGKVAMTRINTYKMKTK